MTSIQPLDLATIVTIVSLAGWLYALLIFSVSALNRWWERMHLFSAFVCVIMIAAHVYLLTVLT